MRRIACRAKMSRVTATAASTTAMMTPSRM